MSALDLMYKRLKLEGGISQQDRMIQDKRKTLDHAILYSYQGAKVQLLDGKEQAPALINPNKVKQDYDDKIISIGYEYGFVPGKIFEWKNTGTKWLIYLQDLTELAYFKGNIRKCGYEIKWKNENNEIQSTYVALIGPTERAITTIIEHTTAIDIPNYSLHILMPKTEETVKYFTRYSKFYLQNNDICWRVEGVDAISTPGILEVHAKEYYANLLEDADGIVGELIIEPIEPEASEIEGESFIKPKRSYTYKYIGNKDGVWEWDKNLPLSVKVNDKEITLSWTTTYNGEFTLSFGESQKTIVVESLF